MGRSLVKEPSQVDGGVGVERVELVAGWVLDGHFGSLGTRPILLAVLYFH